MKVEVSINGVLKSYGEAIRINVEDDYPIAGHFDSQLALFDKVVSKARALLVEAQK